MGNSIDILKGLFSVRKPVLAEPEAPADTNTIIVTNKSMKGRSGTELFGGIFTEEYFRKLHGSAKAKEYDKMRRGDARIKMCLAAVKNPIRSANWFWHAEEEDEQLKKHAEFLNFVMMQDVGLTKKRKFKKILGEAMTCVDFGYSVFERVHKVVLAHPKWGQYIGLRNLAWRSPKTLEYFRVNDEGELTGIEQQVMGDIAKTVTMDAQFLSLITLDQEGDNYEGVSLLRPCYGAWSRKQTDLKLLAIGIEKNAIPTPKAKVPAGQQNSPEYDALVEVLEKLTSHQCNYVTYPEGWEIDFHNANFDPQKVIQAVQFENEEIVFAFLANFLQLGSNGGGGAYALSKDLSDFFTGGIVYIADTIAEELEEIGRELIDLNFGPQEKYPCLKHEGIDDKVGAEFGNLLKSLKDGGYITPDDQLEELLRKRLRLPPMREEDLGKRDKTPEPMDPNDPNADPNDPAGGDPAPDDKDLDKDSKDKKPKKKGELSGWESRVLLAESKAQAVIGDAQARTRGVIQKHLRSIGDSLVEKLMKAYKDAPESDKAAALNGMAASGSAAFLAELKEEMVQIAGEALEAARKEVPKAKDVTLAKKKNAAFTFEELPKTVKKRIQSQVRLLVTTSMADLEKAVFFQFGDSIVSTDSANIIEADLNSAVQTVTNGASVTAAGGNAASRIVNEARVAFFFDEQVLEEIESFTFVNGDPVSEICQSLAGKTFRKDDPEAARLFPPLHHNCKSYIVPNLVGAKDNPPLTPGGLKTKFEPSL